MQLFSEDYLMHYGVKGMKWKKKKAQPPKDPYDPAYYEQYPSSWEELANMSKEEAEALDEHNKRAKKLRKKYNKQRKKVAKTTAKWAAKRGLSRSRRRSTDHFSTNPFSSQTYSYTQSNRHKRKTIKKRTSVHNPGSHWTVKPKPQQNYSK